MFNIMAKTMFKRLTLKIIVLTLLTSCTRQAAPANLAELRYGMSTEPITFDPLHPANTADGRSILFNVFEGLVKPDTSGDLIPALAESYQIEKEGLAYTFQLRPGIMFHNGETLEAADVAFSLNTAMETKFPGLSSIAGVEVLNPTKLQITLKEPDPDFLPYLTIGIVPKNNPDREKNPIGTGPFVIKNYAPQQSLELEKNENYWRKYFPKLNKVTIIFTADTDALLTALRGGNIEGASITGALLSQLQPDALTPGGSRAARFDVIPWASNTVQLLALNNAEKPLDDIRVRLAINYSLDSNEIIETAFYGKGEPSGSPIIPGLKTAYDESLRDPYPRDIEKAKNLLAEAGFQNGFPLEITVPSNYTMHVDTAQVIANQLLDAGIFVSIRLVDWATWLSEVYIGRKYKATIISLDANNVSPRSFLYRYLSDDGTNFINFNSKSFDLAYNAALKEPDSVRRISLYKECQRIISESAASVYIQDILGFRVFSSGRFSGVENYPLYVIDFASMYRLFP
jgi:peptide/nickel transport system substrate-binding protein